jgi:hypothetical protein
MIAVMLAMILIISCISPALAQDPLAGLTALTLDVALNKIADRVDSSIEKAGTVANGVVIRAGSEVWAEIENMRTASKDVLNKAVKDLNSTMTAQLAQVSSDANALESKTAQDAARVLRLAQGVTNTIPFSKTQPQLTSLGPSYAVFDKAKPQEFLLLTFQGNFFDSALAGYAPVLLTPDKKSLEPVEVTTSHFIFSIPTSYFAALSERPLPLVKFSLVVPYRETYWFVFHSRQEARFVATLKSLPVSPGQITVTTTSSMESTQRDSVSTPQDNIQSDRDDHDEDRCGPNETRIIDPSSVAMQVDHSEGGTWTHHPVRLNNPSVCWHFRTEHHGFGTSDKVWFHFTYFATYTVSKEDTKTEPLNLKWGDSRVISAPAGRVTITFTGFDGTTKQYQAANHENRFIDISAEGGGFRIEARPLDGILPLQ